MSIKRLLFALLMSMLATSIQAETVNCTPITSVPVTITAQGIYCLTGKLGTAQTSGYAITINANNVTIDLNGWKVDDGAAGAGTIAYGIYSTANNVTIKNGIVRGFDVGIYLAGSGDVVHDMLVDTNYYVGIWMSGPGALVEHSQVVNTGSTNSSAYGIASQGTGSTVSDNVVSGITAASGLYAEAIDVEGANSVIRNNVTSNPAILSGVTSAGIYNQTGGNTIIVNNTASAFTYGIINTASGIYSFNTVTNCTTDFSGGTAGAANSGN